MREPGQGTDGQGWSLSASPVADGVRLELALPDLNGAPASAVLVLERADEDNAKVINDLSEDMRKELDNIYEAIAALPVKVPQARKLPRPIGYKISESKK